MLAKLLLWCILLAAVTVFVGITLARPTRWYRDSPALRPWHTAWEIRHGGTVMIAGIAAAQVRGTHWLAAACAAIPG